MCVHYIHLTHRQDDEESSQQQPQQFPHCVQHTVGRSCNSSRPQRQRTRSRAPTTAQVHLNLHVTSHCITRLKASDESVATGVAELVAALTADNLELVGLVNNAGVSHRLPFELDNIDKIKALYVGVCVCVLW
jgi:hypothetical protein